MKLHLKPSRGYNSENMKARVVILVRNTSSWPVLYNCAVSWLYSKLQSRHAYAQKSIKGEITQKVLKQALIFVRNTSSWPVLHNCELSSKYSKRYSSYWADTKMFTYGWMYGQTDGWTDARLIAISPEPFGRGIKTLIFYNWINTL